MKHSSNRRPNRLILEITVVVMVKLVLLIIAWQLWFSKPVAPRMRVDPPQIAQQFFGRATVPAIPSDGASHVPP